MCHPWRSYCLVVGGGAGNLWGWEGRWQISSSGTLHQPRRLLTPLPVRSCQWISGMSLNPGSRSQNLFSVEAFTSQIHSKSFQFLLGKRNFSKQRSRGLVLSLTNSCVWRTPVWVARFPFFLSLFCSSVTYACTHITYKPSLLKVVALSSAATQSQEHTGTHCTWSYLHSTERCSSSALNKAAWMACVFWPERKPNKLKMWNHTLPT